MNLYDHWVCLIKDLEKKIRIRKIENKGSKEKEKKCSREKGHLCFMEDMHLRVSW